MPQAAHPQKTANKPEKKFGPYPGGVGVAVWLNTIETQNGPRKLRSVTLAPRRYRDPKTGEWKDAPSYRAGDLPALIFALQQAQEYLISEPIRSDDQDDNGHEQEIPF